MIEPKPKLLKLGETYIKFDYSYNEANCSMVRELVLSQNDLIGSNYLDKIDDLKISIVFKKGSLITSIEFWSCAIFGAISVYGTLRSGLEQIISDVKKYRRK